MPDDERKQDPEEEDEYERKLKEIEDRVRSARKAPFPEPPQWDYQRPAEQKKSHVDQHNYKGLGVGMSMAYTLVGGMILGWAIGWLFDRSTGAVSGQAIGALLGAILGIIAAIALMYRMSDK